MHKREDLKKQSRLKLFGSAKKDFDAIISMIINKYGPKRIVQWGSLLDAEQFDYNSDIDIAVEGIVDASKYFALLGDAMELTRFPLDIVQLEKIEPEFVELILSKGKIIYES
ncbi:MAG: nucleotidyltransferase domain-containing protein [Desulfobacterales bacterium]|nr:nucleotidyltransferase domain-containing protein [Desulfobacterales bacterium]